MSSAGHIIDMVNRAKENMRMIRSRQERMRKIRDKYYDEFQVYHSIPVSENKISPDKMNAIKENIRAELIRERRIWFIKSLIITIVLASGITIFLLSFRIGQF